MASDGSARDGAVVGVGYTGLTICEGSISRIRTVLTAAIFRKFQVLYRIFVEMIRKFLN
jgi:hypothetical protein